MLHIPRSKTDQEAEGAVLYIGRAAAEALRAIILEEPVLDPKTPVFGLSARQIGRRSQAEARAAGLGEGFTGHSGRVGMAQDLAATVVELPALMTAGPVQLQDAGALHGAQAAGRGTVARYYQEYGD